MVADDRTTKHGESFELQRPPSFPDMVEGISDRQEHEANFSYEAVVTSIHVARDSAERTDRWYRFLAHHFSLFSVRVGILLPQDCWTLSFLLHKRTSSPLVCLTPPIDGYLRCVGLFP